jgi:hypothetical protein
LLLPSPSPITAAVSFVLPSAITVALALALAIAIAISITVGHRSCHLHWPSMSLLPSPIAESCCLGVARIVFKQFEQIVVTLFYFVRTVGGALIKTG